MLALRAWCRSRRESDPATPGRRLSNRTRLAVGIAPALLMLLAGTSAPASAHTDLVGSTPGQGSRLTGAPRSISLEFSGAIDPRLVTLVVSVDGGSPSRLGVEAGPASPIVRAIVPSAIGAAPGDETWQVDYRVASVDGHPIQGTFTFAVTPAPRSQEPDEEAVPSTTPPPAAVGRMDAGVQRWVYVAAPLTIAVLAMPGVLVLARRRESRAARSVDRR